MFGAISKRSSLQGAGLLTLAAIVSAPGFASAQETGASKDVSVALEEVVVTARRVEENLQKVPVTVTALSSEQMRQQGIERPTDLQFVAPSVAVGPGLGRLSGGFTVRGLSAGVVTYFAEAPGGPTQVGVPYFDVASVQVLNGPQGTLFGRTAAAGAVLVTPNAPDLVDRDGFAELSIGDYGRIQATAMLNMPIIDDELGVRLAYHHEHIDGFTKQIGGGQKLDETNSDSFRGTLTWRRGAFANTLIANYLNVDDTPPGWVLAAANPNAGVLGLPQAAAPLVYGGPCTQAVAKGLQSSVANCISDRFAAAQQIRTALIAEGARISSGGDAAVRSVPAYWDLPVKQVYRQVSFINTTDFDFEDLGPSTLSARNIFSYQRGTGVSSYGLDGLGGRLLSVAGGTVDGASANVQQSGNDVVPGLTNPNTLLTEELQFRGQAGIANWTLGGYYQEAKSPENLDGFASMARVYSGLLQPNQGWTNSYNFQAGSKSTELAGYGQATIDLDEVGVHGLSLTAGYRYTRSETTARTIQALANPTGTGPFVPSTAPNALQTIATKSKGSNYTFAINEQITPDLLIYATHSKSYVPGGVNAVLGCELAPNCTPTYAPETVKNYELGVKSQFQLGDASMRLNVGVYRMDFENIFQSVQFNSGAQSIVYTQNVASARMQGFETHLDAAWRDVSLVLNYSYLDAGYRDWIGTDPNLTILPTDDCLPGSRAGFCLLDLTDNPFQKAPEHQVNATIRYQLPIDESIGEATVALTGYYQSRQYNVSTAVRQQEVAEALGLSALDRDALSQKPYGKLNLRVQWNNVMGSNVSLGAFVDNLTDTTYSQAGGSNFFTLGSAFKLYAPPRMWGVTLRYAWND